MGETIYKLCREAEWQQALAQGEYRGSADDHRDGFIHFSGPDQVVETAARHCAGIADLLLLSIDAAALGPALKWEKSRAGQPFPHLYGFLPLAAVRHIAKLPLGPDGKHSFPPL